MNIFSIELIGIISTAFILISMCINSTTIKGAVVMRIFNLIGSLIFVVYGILLPAISTAILNATLAIINAAHLIKLIFHQKNNSNYNNKKDA